jgi:hypothetical protein
MAHDLSPCRASRGYEIGNPGGSQPPLRQNQLAPGLGVVHPPADGAGSTGAGTKAGGADGIGTPGGSQPPL